MEGSLWDSDDFLLAVVVDCRGSHRNTVVRTAALVQNVLSLVRKAFYSAVHRKDIVTFSF